MPLFKQIWFDFDGTLVVPTDAFNHAHDDLRYNLFAEVTKQPLTPTVRAQYNAIYQECATNSAVFKSLGLPDSFWMDRYEAADLAQYYEYREDIPRVLNELAGRAKLGLFTNNKRAEVERTLVRLQIPLSLFANTLTGDEITERKPLPGGFKQMLKIAACEPAALLFVGDRYGADVEPTQKLGAKGALVWGEDPRADYNFPTFEDLLTLN